MAHKILFTEDALVDLEIILDYIRADNPSAAERFGTGLLNTLTFSRTFHESEHPSRNAQASEKSSIRLFGFITGSMSTKD